MPPASSPRSAPGPAIADFPTRACRGRTTCSASSPACPRSAACVSWPAHAAEQLSEARDRSRHDRRSTVPAVTDCRELLGIIRDHGFDPRHPSPGSDPSDGRRDLRPSPGDPATSGISRGVPRVSHMRKSTVQRFTGSAEGARGDRGETAALNGRIGSPDGYQRGQSRPAIHRGMGYRSSRSRLRTTNPTLAGRSPSRRMK